MSERFRVAFLSAALLAATLLLIVLAWRHSQLREDYAALVERGRTAHPGMLVPTATLATVAGDTVTIGDPPAGAADILLFFTTTCDFCRASIPAWRRLAREAASHARDGEIRVLGVALDSAHLAADYASAHELPYAVVPTLDRKLGNLYRVRGVPTVMVVREGGTLLFARSGVMESGAPVDSVLLAAVGSAAPRTADRAARSP